MHAGWLTPLRRPDGTADRVRRNVIQAAYWASIQAGKQLEEYLKTREGKPYASQWGEREVQQADQFVASNPMQG